MDVNKAEGQWHYREYFEHLHATNRPQNRFFSNTCTVFKENTLCHWCVRLVDFQVVSTHKKGYVENIKDLRILVCRLSKRIIKITWRVLIEVITSQSRRMFGTQCRLTLLCFILTDIVLWAVILSPQMKLMHFLSSDKHLLIFNCFVYIMAVNLNFMNDRISDIKDVFSSLITVLFAQRKRLPWTLVCYFTITITKWDLYSAAYKAGQRRWTE